MHTNKTDVTEQGHQQAGGVVKGTGSRGMVFLWVIVLLLAIVGFDVPAANAGAQLKMHFATILGWARTFGPAAARVIVGIYLFAMAWGNAQLLASYFLLQHLGRQLQLSFITF